MVERNLIREGYVYNTLTSSGTMVGSQAVSVDQINLLVDEDLSSTAFTISSGQTISLDVDLGARWKIKRLEYYTHESSSSNINISISQNNIDFFPIPVSNAGPYFLGTIPLPTESGSPRYIRLSHVASSGTIVREFSAISDDTQVDFGTDGLQTEVVINDSPIGRVSSIVTELPILNRSTTQSVDARIFVDRSFTAADDEVEISASENGPWVGRNTTSSIQPLNTEWDNGSYINTRKVPSVSYDFDFSSSTSTGNWVTSGLTSVTLPGGVYRGTALSGTCSFSTVSGTIKTIASDANTVKVSLRVPTISGGYTGPTLFWLTQDAGTYAASRSIDASNPFAYNGQTREYTFNVGAMPTWSGIISDIRIVPFVTSSGFTSGHTVELDRVRVGNFDGDRVALAGAPYFGGTAQILSYDEVGGSLSRNNTDRVFLNFENRVNSPCVITKVRMVGNFSITGGNAASKLMLLSLSPSFPASGTATVKNSILVSSKYGTLGSISPSVSAPLLEFDVFWPAASGDAIAYALGNAIVSIGLGYRTRTNAGYESNTSVSVSTFPPETRFATWTANNQQYMVSYEAVPLRYSSSGRYVAPVFDLGDAVQLTSANYESSEASGTSIDTDTASAFKTFNARASSTPPVGSVETYLHGTFTGNRFRINSGLSSPNTLHINSFQSSSSPQLAGPGVYNEDTGETWVLASICSGTAPNTVSPVINIFNFPDLNYATRQFHIKNIGYTYNNPETTTDKRFDPIGISIDYSQQEIYIVQSSASFFLGSVAYYGIVVDYDGNYKRLVFRESDIPLDGSFDLIEHSQHMVFDGTYFYFLSPDATSGGRMYIFKLDENLQISHVDTKTISAMPGLSFSTSSRPPRLIMYHSEEDLIYLVWNTISSTDTSPTVALDRDPRYYAMRFTPDINDLFTVTLVRQGDFPVGEPLLTTTDGYTRRIASLASTDLNSGLVTHYLGKGMYLPHKNTFGVFTYEFATKHVDEEPLQGFQTAFFTEIGAGVSGTWNTGTLPQINDAVWGSVSGSLSYQPVQKDSVLFPNGRYAQVEYTFNSDTGLRTPYLLESGFNEGILLQGVPTSGTRSVYLRTNIPEDADLATRSGQLKVYWPLDE